MLPMKKKCDCGCDACDKAPMLNESKQYIAPISEGMRYHLSNQIQLHENIFNLLWHGEGRWDWDTIYNMPIFLRKFYIKRVNAIIQERIDRAEQQQKQKSRTPTKSPR